jgi:hypothetical protein
MAETLCPRCGEPTTDHLCKGDDSDCVDQNRACARWEPYCCYCGPRWAMDQL